MVGTIPEHLYINIPQAVSHQFFVKLHLEKEQRAGAEQPFQTVCYFLVF